MCTCSAVHTHLGRFEKPDDAQDAQDPEDTQEHGRHWQKGGQLRGKLVNE